LTTGVTVDALSGSSVDDLAAASDEAAGAETDAVTGTDDPDGRDAPVAVDAPDDGAAVDVTGSFTGD
jgi:hypothetical protein